jgi:protein-tyrosine phosphatase
MLPLIDMHCHLLAGLDDGPRTQEDALEMCRIAAADGIRTSAATAHQNETWQEVTPQRIRAAARQLAVRLHESNIPLTVLPCAEVMLQPNLEASWRQGAYLSVADRGQYLLIEMPHGLCVDLQPIIEWLRPAGVRPILAHAERVPELLHDAGRIEDLIRAGCLIQVNSGSVTDPTSRADAQALKDWFRRGVVHVLGSDGHSPRRRRPHLAAAYQQIASWAGSSVADRVCSTNGTAILHGLPLRIPEPQPRARRWFARFW